MSYQENRLLEIADAIRQAEGSMSPIPAREFPDRIKLLSKGLSPLSITDTGFWEKPMVGKIAGPEDYPDEPTFIVDSQETFNDFRSNKAGNDYTTVCFKNGHYELKDSYFNLTVTGCKRVFAENECYIFHSGPNHTFMYETLPDTSLDNYYIKNFIHIESFSFAYFSYRCPYVSDVYIKTGYIAQAFFEATNIENIRLETNHCGICFNNTSGTVKNFTFMGYCATVISNALWVENIRFYGRFTSPVTNVSDHITGGKIIGYWTTAFTNCKNVTGVYTRSMLTTATEFSGGSGNVHYEPILGAIAGPEDYPDEPTYYVTSQADLDLLTTANSNPQNDFRVVCFKPGTYNLTAVWNMYNTKTDMVFAENGTKLNITTANIGMTRAVPVDPTIERNYFYNFDITFNNCILYKINFYGCRIRVIADTSVTNQLQDCNFFGCEILANSKSTLIRYTNHGKRYIKDSAILINGNDPISFAVEYTDFEITGSLLLALGANRLFTFQGSYRKFTVKDCKLFSDGGAAKQVFYTSGARNIVDVQDTDLYVRVDTPTTDSYIMRHTGDSVYSTLLKHLHVYMYNGFLNDKYFDFQDGSNNIGVIMEDVYCNCTSGVVINCLASSINVTDSYFTQSVSNRQQGHSTCKFIVSNKKVTLENVYYNGSQAYPGYTITGIEMTGTLLSIKNCTLLITHPGQYSDAVGAATGISIPSGLTIEDTMLKVAGTPCIGITSANGAAIRRCTINASSSYDGASTSIITTTGSIIEDCNIAAASLSPTSVGVSLGTNNTVSGCSLTSYVQPYSSATGYGIKSTGQNTISNNNLEIIREPGELNIAATLYGIYAPSDTSVWTVGWTNNKVEIHSNTIIQYYPTGGYAYSGGKKMAYNEPVAYTPGVEYANGTTRPYAPSLPTYQNCYASADKTIPVAYTEEGGWNKDFGDL